MEGRVGGYFMHILYKVLAKRSKQLESVFKKCYLKQPPPPPFFLLRIPSYAPVIVRTLSDHSFQVLCCRDWWKLPPHPLRSTSCLVIHTLVEEAGGRS